MTRLVWCVKASHYVSQCGGASWASLRPGSWHTVIIIINSHSLNITRPTFITWCGSCGSSGMALPARLLPPCPAAFTLQSAAAAAHGAVMNQHQKSVLLLITTEDKLVLR